MCDHRLHSSKEFSVYIFIQDFIETDLDIFVFHYQQGNGKFQHLVFQLDSSFRIWKKRYDDVDGSKLVQLVLPIRDLLGR